MREIYFLGPQGSYSNIIVKKIFNKKDYFLTSCDSFLQVINNTIFTKGSIGILPIENSITSDIHENIDYLFKNDLIILAEAFLKINLHLIGLTHATLSGITDVYSHPRALAQCTKFIEKNHISTHETPSTASGCDMILKENNNMHAVIGSRELLRNNHLSIIEENIGNDTNNLTRFVCVARKSSIKTFSHRRNKASIIFTLLHLPGTLATILTEFARMQLNVTKIESRPIPGTDWEYAFWIDIEDKKNIDIKSIEAMLKKHTLSYKIVGVYQKGGMFES
jgi:prephenate dehydratase